MKSKKRKKRSGQKAKRRKSKEAVRESLSFEALEPRKLLAVDILAWEDSGIATTDLFEVFKTEHQVSAETTSGFTVVSNSNGNLVEPNIAENNLHLELGDNQSGNAVVTVSRQTNDGSPELSVDFSIAVSPVNDTPYTTGLPEMRLDEGEVDSAGVVVSPNSATIDLSEYFADVETASGNLSYGFYGSSEDPHFNSRSKYGNPVERVDLVGSMLTVTPSTEFFGFAELPVYAEDDGDGTDTEPRRVAATLWILVDDVNDTPRVTGSGGWTVAHTFAADNLGTNSDRNASIDLRQFFEDEEDKSYLTYAVTNITTDVTYAPGADTSAPLFYSDPQVVDDINDVLHYELGYEFHGTAIATVTLTATDREGATSDAGTLIININSLGEAERYEGCSGDCPTGPAGAVGTGPQLEADLTFWNAGTEDSAVPDDMEETPGTTVAENSDFTEDNWEKQSTVVGGIFTVDQMVEVRDNQLDRGLSNNVVMHNDDVTEDDWRDQPIDTDRDLRPFSVDVKIDGSWFQGQPVDYEFGWYDLNVTLEYDAQNLNLWANPKHLYGWDVQPQNGFLRPVIADHHIDQNVLDISRFFQDGQFIYEAGQGGGSPTFQMDGPRFVVEGMSESSSDIEVMVTGTLWWRVATPDDSGQIYTRQIEEPNPAADKLTTHVAKVEIALDASGGNQVVHEPVRTPQINQHRPTVIVVNSRDDDRDGVVDYHDGFDQDQQATNPDQDAQVSGDPQDYGFTPIDITLSDTVDLSKARFWFYYQDSDPADSQMDDDGIRTRDGYGLRIWTQDKTDARNPNVANAVDPDPNDGIDEGPGDFVANMNSGQDGPWDLDLKQLVANSLEGTVPAEHYYTYEQLGGEFDPVTGEPVSNTFRLYLEGVNPGRYTVGVAVDPDGGPEVSTDPGGGTGPGTGGPALLTTPEADLFVGYGLVDKFFVNVVEEISVSASNQIAAEDSVAPESDPGTFLISRHIGNTHSFTNNELPIVNNPQKLPGLDVFYRIQFPANEMVHPSDPLTVSEGSDYYTYDSNNNKVSLAFEDNTWYGKVTLEPGQSQVAIKIYTRDDQLVEWDESLNIELRTHNQYRQDHRIFNETDRKITAGDTRESLQDDGHLRAIPNDGIVGERQYYHFTMNNRFEEDREAAVEILDNDELAATRSNNVDTESTGEQLASVSNNPFVAANVVDGSLELLLFAGSRNPNYRANDNLVPLLTFETQIPLFNNSFPSASSLPVGFAGIVSVGGVEGLEAPFDLNQATLNEYFNQGTPPDWGQFNPFHTVKFVVVGPESLVSKLPTGSYDYDLRILAEYDSGDPQTENPEAIRTIRGRTEIINRVNDDFGWDEFGDRWWVEEIQRVVADDGATLPAAANENDKIDGQLDDQGVPTQTSNSSASRLARLGAKTQSTFSVIRGDNTSAHYFADPDLTTAQVVHPDYSVENDASYVADEVVWQAGDWEFTTTNRDIHTGPKEVLYRYSAGGMEDRDDVFTWKFDNLEVGKPVQLFVNYDAGIDRASNAQYVVRNAQAFGSGQTDKVIYVDQRFIPGELIHDDLNWRSLGFFVPTQAAVQIELHTKEGDEQADGYVTTGSAMLVDNWAISPPPAGTFSELAAKTYDRFADDTHVPNGTAANYFGLETKFGNRYEFDNHGLLTGYQDRNRNRTEYTYQDLDNDGLADEIQTITDQGGLSTDYSWSSGNLVITDPTGLDTTITFGPSDSVANVTLPDPQHANSQVVDYDFEYSGSTVPALSAVVTSLGRTEITYIGDAEAIDSEILVTNPDQLTWYLISELADPFKAAQPSSGRVLLAESPTGGLAETVAEYGDGMDTIWFFQNDDFGLMTARTDPETTAHVEAPDVVTLPETKRQWLRNLHGQVTGMIQPAGSGGYTRYLDELSTVIEFDASFDPVSITHPDGTKELFTYDPEFHVLTSYTDRNENLYTYQLDGYGNTSLTVDPSDEDTEQRQTKNEYTNAPTAISDLAGGLLTKLHRAFGSPDVSVAKTDYLDSGVKIGLISQVTAALGEPEEVSHLYTYDNNRLLATQTDPEGFVKDFEYDRLGQLVKTTLPAAIPGESRPVFENFYDGAGNLIKTVDPRSNETEYTYDSMHRLEVTTLPLVTGASGRTTVTNNYNGNGLLSKTTEAVYSAVQTFPYNVQSQVTDFFYDERNQTVASVDAEGNRTQSSYDTAGNVEIQIDAEGQTTQFVYDEMHRTMRVIDVAMGETDYDYDDNGNLVELTTPRGRYLYYKTVYDYDALNRQIRTAVVEGSSNVKNEIKTEYDRRNNITKVIDGNGHKTDFGFDKLDRVIAETDHHEKTIQFEYDDNSNLISTIDRRNTETEYSYDRLNRQTNSTVEATDTDGNPQWITTSTEYDLAGNVVRTVDPNGVEATYEFNELNGLKKTTTTATDDLGNQQTITSEAVHDSSGRIEKSTNARGVETAFEYDRLDRVFAETTQGVVDGNGTPQDHRVETQYDALGKVREIKDVLRDITTTYVHDEVSREITTTDAFLNNSTQHFDPNGNLIKTVDRRGGVTVYDYDSQERQILTRQFVNVNESDPTDQHIDMTTSYDPVGNVASTTDGNGNLVSYEYDALNRQRFVKELDSNGVEHVTEHTYDENGNLLSTKNPRGYTTTFEYDEVNRQVRQTDANSNTSETHYDANSNVIKSVDRNGNATSVEYDEVNRPFRTTFADGTQSIARYDENGNVIESIDQRGLSTQFSFDDLDRVIGTTFEDGTGTEIKYFDDVLIHHQVDQFGKTTIYEQDKLGQTVEVTNANAEVTQYNYDEENNQIELIDPESNITNWTYDALGRPTVETNAFGNERQFTYDGNGNVVNMVDRNGRATINNYNFRNQLKQELWIDGAVVQEQKDYQYDANGNLESASDDRSQYTFIFDNLDRVESSTSDLTHLAVGFDHDSSYDASGNRTQLSISSNAVSQIQNDYTFDSMDRMSTARQAGQAKVKFAGFSYDANGQFAEIYRPSLTTTYTRDNMNRLTDLEHESLGHVVNDYQWVYDNKGRLGSTSSIDGTSDFTYDDTDQITVVDHSYQSDEQYSYDDNGNRTNTGYVIGLNNQIQSDGTFIYTYDDEGNRTTKEEIASGDETEYKYDYDNRLIEIKSTTGGSTPTLTQLVEYDYDVFGRRIGKRVTDGTTDAQTGEYVWQTEEYFVFDGLRTDRGNAGDHIALVLNADGDVVQRNFFGPAVDQILAEENVDPTTGDTTVQWALTDHQGTVRDVLEIDDQAYWNQVFVEAGNLRHGVAVDDAATGTGYLMYSEESLHTRFGDVHVDNADHFVAVRYNGGWEYNNDSSWVAFSPQSSDLLVASVDFDADTGELLGGTNSLIEGIVAGFAYSDLTVAADRWKGQADDGEFELTGNYLVRNQIQATSIGDANSGVMVADFVNRKTFLMYSATDLGTRFADLPVDNASNLIVIRRRFHGGLWQYNNGTDWVTFMPEATDVLVGEIFYNNDTYNLYEGVDSSYLEFKKGYVSGDLDIVLNQYAGQPADNDIEILGTHIVFHPSDSDLAFSDAVVTHVTYDAFGNVTSAGGVPSRYGYTGREVDPESDLMFYRARYYDSSTGQFIAEDPIGFDAGDTNLRRYVGNRASYAVDPSGLMEDGLKVKFGEYDPDRLREEAVRFFKRNPEATAQDLWVHPIQMGPFQIGQKPRTFGYYYLEALHKVEVAKQEAAIREFNRPKVSRQPHPNSWAGRRISMYRVQWAFLDENVGNPEATRIKNRVRYYSGTFFPHGVNHPREDTHAVLKAFGAVPGVGMPALAGDAAIRFYFGEWEKGLESTLEIGVNFAGNRLLSEAGPVSRAGARQSVDDSAIHLARTQKNAQRTIRGSGTGAYRQVDNIVTITNNATIKGAVSETTGAVTNLGTRTVAENSELFAKLRNGQGMSGVYDHVSGNFVLRPSEHVPIGPPQPGWVQRYQGHASVRADLGEAIGQDLSRGLPGNGRLSGFSLSKNADGVTFGWNSRTINEASHHPTTGARFVPENLRSEIERAVRSALGL